MVLVKKQINALSPGALELGDVTAPKKTLRPKCLVNEFDIGLNAIVRVGVGGIGRYRRCFDGDVGKSGQAFEYAHL